MKRLLVFFLIGRAFFSTGQMLDNRDGNAFTDKPFFNKDFIKANKIREIKGKFNYKKPGEVMRMTTFNYVYEFDTIGRLFSTFETRTDDGTVDTTWNKYEYDQFDRLIAYKKGDGKGFTVIRYELDDKGRIVKESYAREYTDSLGEKQVTVFSSETMKYEEFGSQVKKTIFNNYGLPYMYEFFSYDSLGYLVRKEQRLIRSSEFTEYIYLYDEKGFLSQVDVRSAPDGDPDESTRFLYDEFGNVVTKNYYKSGVYKTENEILYNEKSKMLTYVITREVATNFMMIIGFRDYQFYE